MFLLKVLKGLLFLDGVGSREAKFFVLQQKKDVCKMMIHICMKDNFYLFFINLSKVIK